MSAATAAIRVLFKARTVDREGCECSITAGQSKVPMTDQAKWARKITADRPDQSQLSHRQVHRKRFWPLRLSESGTQIKLLILVFIAAGRRTRI